MFAASGVLNVDGAVWTRADILEDGSPCVTDELSEPKDAGIVDGNDLFVDLTAMPAGAARELTDRFKTGTLSRLWAFRRLRDDERLSQIAREAFIPCTNPREEISVYAAPMSLHDGPVDKRRRRAGVRAPIPDGERTTAVSVAPPATGANSPYSFVKLLFSATPIDKFSSHIGAGFIEALREHLYSYMVATYPELKHLPREKFGEFFTFNITPSEWGFFLELGVKGVETPINSRHPVRMEISKKKGSTGLYSVIEDVMQRGWILLMRGIQEKDCAWEDIEGANIGIDNLLNGLLRLVHAVDFTHVIRPGQLGVMLKTRHPELALYIDRDELLRLAMQNPEALAEHVRNKIAEATRQIQELVERHRIDELEAEKRIAALRSEEETVRRRVAGLLRDEKARRAELERLEKERVRLRGEIAYATELIQRAIEGETSSYEVVLQLGNMGVISLEDKVAESQLRAAVESVVAASLTSELYTMREIHGQSWDGAKLKIRIVASVSSHTRSGRRASSVEILVKARIQTPSYSEEAWIRVPIQIMDGKLCDDAAEKLKGFISSALMSQLEAKAAALIAHESASPRRSALEALVVERMTRMDSGTPSARLGEALLSLLAEAEAKPSEEGDGKK